MVTLLNFLAQILVHFSKNFEHQDHLVDLFLQCRQYLTEMPFAHPLSNSFRCPCTIVIFLNYKRFLKSMYISLIINQKSLFFHIMTWKLHNHTWMYLLERNTKGCVTLFQNVPEMHSWYIFPFCLKYLDKHGVIVLWFSYTPISLVKPYSTFLW